MMDKVHKPITTQCLPTFWRNVLGHQSNFLDIFNLNMEAIISPETSVTVYQSTHHKSQKGPLYACLSLFFKRR
jgi:hypothetical protein